jgi:hypothetical protein
MGQQEVYDFLMKNPDMWYTSKQISEQLIVSIGSVTMSLKKLRKTNIIKFRNTGKRNTFQYMVQSEPTKAIERKTPYLDEARHEPTKVKVKIKPKIVHQHSYLGGQTFYGVIRPKEEVDAIERARDEEPSLIQAQAIVRKTSSNRKKALQRKLTAAARMKTRKVKHRRVAKVVRKVSKPKAKVLKKRVKH